jgi:hypothetical protein
VLIAKRGGEFIVLSESALFFCKKAIEEVSVFEHMGPDVLDHVQRPGEDAV